MAICSWFHGKISISLRMTAFKKNCDKNKFFVLVKMVHFFSILDFLEKCPTLQGCGVQTA